MKKTILLFLLLTSVFSNAQVDYELTVLSEEYINLESATSINNGEIWDDPAFTIPIGFDFQLGSMTINTIFIPDEGAGGLLSTDANVNVATLGALAPVLQDLVDRGDNSGVSVSPLSFKLDGNEGNQILKIEWNNAGFFEDNNLEDFVNFQVWLYEGSNIIEYRYGPSEINNPSNSFEDLDGLQIGLFPLLGDGASELLENAYLLSGDPLSPDLIVLTTTEELDNAEFTAVTGAVPDGTVYRFSEQELSLNDQRLTHLQIYPNPSSGFFRINSKKEDYKVDVFSVTGQKVMSTRSQEEYDISALPKGMYLVTIQSPEGSTTRKLIKI